jgi:hypothetical protein
MPAQKKRWQIGDKLVTGRVEQTRSGDVSCFVAATVSLPFFIIVFLIGSSFFFFTKDNRPNTHWTGLDSTCASKWNPENRLIIWRNGEKAPGKIRYPFIHQ